ncbi:MAG TPA: addiction module protein [Haloferula sp.]
MSLAEIEKQAAALPVEERAALASFLLHSLPEPDHDVSDEEVAERVRQVNEGEVDLISFEELRRGVFADRAH